MPISSENSNFLLSSNSNGGVRWKPAPPTNRSGAVGNRSFATVIVQELVIVRTAGD